MSTDLDSNVDIDVFSLSTINERIRNSIRTPRRLRVRIADIVYDLAKLKRLIDQRIAAGKKLDLDEDTLAFLKKVHMMLSRVSDLLLSSHNLGKLGFNLSLVRELLDKLVADVRSRDVILVGEFEELQEKVEELAEEARDYIKPPSKRVVSRYAEYMYEEILGIM